MVSACEMRAAKQPKKHTDNRSAHTPQPIWQWKDIHCTCRSPRRHMGSSVKASFVLGKQCIERKNVPRENAWPVAFRQALSKMRPSHSSSLSLDLIYSEKMQHCKQICHGRSHESWREKKGCCIRLSQPFFAKSCRAQSQRPFQNEKYQDYKARSKPCATYKHERAETAIAGSPVQPDEGWWSASMHFVLLGV